MIIVGHRSSNSAFGANNNRSSRCINNRHIKQLNIFKIPVSSADRLMGTSAPGQNRDAGREIDSSHKTQFPPYIPSNLSKKKLVLPRVFPSIHKFFHTFYQFCQKKLDRVVQSISHKIQYLGAIIPSLSKF